MFNFCLSAYLLIDQCLATGLLETCTECKKKMDVGQEEHNFQMYNSAAVQFSQLLVFCLFFFLTEYATSVYFLLQQIRLYLFF